MFTLNQNKKYVKNLDKLVENYNNSFHRSIKNKPININKTNENVTFKILYDNSSIIEFKFQKGDYVRVVIDKDMKFKKGSFYSSIWHTNMI